VGLGPIVANRFKSALLDIPSCRSVSSTNWELTFADGAGTTTKMVPTDNGGHIRLYMENSWRFSAKRRRHSHRIGQLTMQSTWSPAIFGQMGGFTIYRSWVEWYSRNCVDKDHVLKRPDHAFGFGLNDPMPFGRIDESVFSEDGRYVTRWIMGLQWRVNGRQILWRSVTITCGELTEL